MLPVYYTSGTGTLKASAGEIMVGEYLTLHQFEHTKLIGHCVTFGINSILFDVCCGTIVAAQEQAIFFD